VTVPFYFKVVNCRRFLTKNAFLRKTHAHRFMLNVCAYSGVGCLSLHALQYFFQQRRKDAHVTTAEVGNNDEEIDGIWEHVKSSYGLIAVRDGRTLDILYPPFEKRFRRLKVYSHERCIGWVVTLCTQMTSHKQFGSLRVGSIVDCLSQTDDASTIIHAAASELTKQGADILVANHSHRAWGKAFENAGFLRGPSNFIFGASVALAERVETCAAGIDEIYFMRGDGDGPINL
jgi:hypothetical protein